MIWSMPSIYKEQNENPLKKKKNHEMHWTYFPQYVIAPLAALFIYFN